LETASAVTADRGDASGVKCWPESAVIQTPVVWGLVIATVLF